MLTIVHFLGLQKLNFFSVGLIFTINSFEHSLPYLPIFLDEVRCTGSEERLTDCVHNDFSGHNCTHSQDLAVKCQGMYVHTCSYIIILFRYIVCVFHSLCSQTM